MNHDHSAAYVVKIHRREQTKDQLHSTFLAEANNWLGQNSMTQADRQAFTQAVQEQIKERIGFEFNEEWMEEAQHSRIACSPRDVPRIVEHPIGRYGELQGQTCNSDGRLADRATASLLAVQTRVETGCLLR